MVSRKDNQELDTHGMRIICGTRVVFKTENFE